MKYIAVDIEMDQPSGDIIHIGASAWDTDIGKEVESFQRFIKCSPNWDYELNTGKTLGDLLPFTQIYLDEYGIDKQEAISEFWQWISSINCSKKIIQWGSGDIRTLVEQTDDKSLIPNRLEVIDVKQLYKTLVIPALQLPKKSSLMDAYKNMGGMFPFYLWHNAYIDALATAKIYYRIFKMLRLCKIVKENL